MRSTRTLAAAGSLGLGFLGLVIVSGPVWQPGFNPLSRYGSELALGANGWLMTSAFVIGGFGTWAVASAIYRTLAASRLRTLGCGLLVVLGAGLIASAAVPTGPHRPGVHEFIGIASFVCVLLALPILARGMAHQPSLAGLSTLGRSATAVSLLALAVTILFASPGGDAPARPLDAYAGLLQKLFIAPWLTWLAVVGYRIARAGRSSERLASQPV